MSIKVRSLGTLLAQQLSGILITAGAAATPWVATTTAGHRQKTGDRVAITGITTQVGSNGEFTISTVAASALTMLGSKATGTFGGTADVAALMDTTPFQAGHSAAAMIGNASGSAVFIGTMIFQGADAMKADLSEFGYTATTGLYTSGWTGVLVAGEIAIPAASAGLSMAIEVKLKRYMRANCTAYTSGGAHASLLA